VKTIILSLLLSVVCIELFAQIVNIEDKRKNYVDTSGLFGNVDLGFNLVENGRTITTIKAAVRLEYLKEKHLILALTKYNLIKAAGTNFINDGFQHLRYNYQLKPRMTYEAFVQAQYNERLNLKVRFLAGTGLRFQIVDAAEQKAFLGLLYMYEFNEETDPKVFRRDHRLSSYLSFQLRPTGNMIIAGTSYFQPLLTDFNDLRLSSETSLIINLTKRLRFKTTFNISYDSKVPEGVVNTFYSFVNGLRWVF